MASSSSSSRVFLSFRGEDTRENFISHLYEALCSKKINTFIDCYDLERGDEISQALSNAIEESMITVIVFSKGYPSSRWCLEELAKIIECKKARDLMVVPVFYHMDPSDVRNQTGTFGEAFVKHEEKQSSGKVMRWRNALKEAADLSGYDSSSIRPEAVLVEEIVKNILEKLNKMSPSENKDLVGIESKIEKLESLLRPELKDVSNRVGIWGMGGIGKTTLACAIFTRISSQFDNVYFQSNVREESEKFGLIRLRQDLLAAILNDRNAILESTFTKSRLRSKKVLIVFDDVTCFEQIEKLIGHHECFGSGSRIIITSRDKQVLKNCGVGRDNIYEVEGLPFDEALILFSRYAFKRDHPREDCNELSVRVMEFAQGVPLALKILGASLFEKKKSEWKSALYNLERYPNPKIQDVLKISYDGLDDEEKNIFLDIACFLIGVTRNIATEILDYDYFDSKMGVCNLIDKSLITKDSEISYLDGTVSFLDRIVMHDLLQEMGKKIVKQESKDPSERSRLWHHDDIYHVIRRNTGTKAIESISLDISKIKEINLKCDAFSKMSNLKFLDFYYRPKDSRRRLQCYCRCFSLDQKIDEGIFMCEYCLVDKENVNKVCASQGLEFSSSNIRYFRWFGYPLDSLPSNFEVENLFALIMPYSKIKQLWNGCQHSHNLKHINLIHSRHLIRIPNLSLVPNLESLILEGCTSLIEVHSSIQYLNKLVILNLKGCKSLGSLPTDIQSKFLTDLILSGCSNLKKAPKITCNMKRVYFDRTSITKLPLIEYPSKLYDLNLEDCSRLECLPSILCELKFLEYLRISYCSKLHNLPQQLGKLNNLRILSLRGYRGQDLMESSLWSYFSFLTILDLSDCRIRWLPNTLGKLHSLQSLSLSENNFEWIPSSFTELNKLTELNISNCKKLKCISLNVRFIEAYNCKSLELLDFDRMNNANFGNCLKLDQNKVKAILEQSLFCDHLFLPGHEITKGYSFQNEGSSITLEVPPLALNKLCSRVGVCLVVTSQDHDKAPQYLFFRYTAISRDKYGETQEVREGIITISRCYSLMSDHVLQSRILTHRWAKTESQYLTFDFKGEYYNVGKCGVELEFHKDCTEEKRKQVKQYKGDLSSNMEEEPQPKRLKL